MRKRRDRRKRRGPGEGGAQDVSGAAAPSLGVLEVSTSGRVPAFALGSPVGPGPQGSVGSLRQFLRLAEAPQIWRSLSWLVPSPVSPAVSWWPCPTSPSLTFCPTLSAFAVRDEGASGLDSSPHPWGSLQWPHQPLRALAGHHPSLGAEHTLAGSSGRCGPERHDSDQDGPRVLSPDRCSSCAHSSPLKWLRVPPMQSERQAPSGHAWSL